MNDFFARFGKEPSAVDPAEGIALTGNTLSTSSENRAEDCVEVALADENSRHLALAGGRIIMKGEIGQDAPAQALFEQDELTNLDPDIGETVLLGHTQDGQPRLANHVNIDLENLPDGFVETDFRTAYINGYLSRDDEGTLAQGGALMAWNRSNKFCGRCGGQMVMESGGYRRGCTQCEAKIFPRTDPVVIALTIDQKNDRCIMGRSPHFPQGMFSCLAGFVDAGETLENAVRRETKEESGIDVGRVAYYSSQPWPAPHTLMIGCFAEAISEDISFDSEELEDCRWFSRAQVLEMMETPHGTGGAEFVPPRGAIANLLIRDWALAR